MAKRAVSDDGGLTAQAFSAWMKRHQLTGAAVARMFGVSPETVCRWRKEGGPKILYWACKAYDSGVRPDWVQDAIKPPMKATDGRKRNVPPHLREAAKGTPRDVIAVPRRVSPVPSRPAVPEWPVDPTYE